MHRLCSANTSGLFFNNVCKTFIETVYTTASIYELLSTSKERMTL